MGTLANSALVLVSALLAVLPIASQANGESNPELVGIGIEGASSWAILKEGERTEVFTVGEVAWGSWKLTRVGPQCITVESLKDQRPARLCLSTGAGAGFKHSPIAEPSNRKTDSFIVPVEPSTLLHLSRSLEAWVGHNGSGHMVSAPGKPTGFAIDRLGERGFLRSIGIREGDIVSAINGVAATSESTLSSAVTNVNDEMVEVVFYRDGNAHSSAIRLSDEVLAILKSTRVEVAATPEG
jgi:hypothetical protein